MKKHFGNNVWRNVLQLSLLGFVTYYWGRVIINPEYLVDFEAYCPMGGFQAFVNMFISGNLACSMSEVQVMMGIALAIGVVLFSKLFCGYLCPLGTINEFISKWGRKLKVQVEVGRVTDLVLRALKYVLLVVTFYGTLTTSELFCKKFDPFFSTVSLYGHDVTAWAATLAIALMVGGSLFFRLFWCKYLCPLGALSNLFKFIYVIAVIWGGWGILRFAGLEIHWLYPLILTGVAGYVVEIVKLRNNKTLQMLQVVRNTEKCIDCGLCTRGCPQGIEVADMEKVTHVDCNLCGDCVGACPVSGALNFNEKRKFRWLPVLLTVVLVMAGVLFGNKVEMATVDQRWGDKEAIENAGVYEHSGLKSIKCYGSSISFVNQMRRVPGVLGVATYVRNHKVRILYDKTTMSEEKIRRAIFSPVQVFVRDVKENDEKIQVIHAEIDNFFDQMDVFYLEIMSKQIPGIYNFQTMYGEPVKVNFFTSTAVNVDSLKHYIESRVLTFKSGGVEYNHESKFRVRHISLDESDMTGLQLKKQLFPSFKRAFNNRNQYENSELAFMTLKIADYPRNSQMMPYLMNSVGKANKYIVGLVAMYDEDYPILRVFYVHDKTTPEDVYNEVTKENLTINYSNGVVEEMENPYKFENTQNTEE